MNKLLSSREVCDLIFKDDLHFATLLKWCRKGLLAPYRYSKSGGNKTDRSLFCESDMVVAGILNNFFYLGLSHEELLNTVVEFSWLAEEGIPPREVLWQDMGRELQGFLEKYKYEVILRTQFHSKGRGPIQVYEIEDTFFSEQTERFVFGRSGGFTGAVIIVNANTIYIWLHALLCNLQPK